MHTATEPELRALVGTALQFCEEPDRVPHNPPPRLQEYLAHTSSGRTAPHNLMVCLLTWCRGRKHPGGSEDVMPNYLIVFPIAWCCTFVLKVLCEFLVRCRGRQHPGGGDHHLVLRPPIFGTYLLTRDANPLTPEDEVPHNLIPHPKTKCYKSFFKK